MVKDHLLKETTFIISLGWSLNTGYTVPTKYVLLQGPIIVFMHTVTS